MAAGKASSVLRKTLPLVVSRFFGMVGGSSFRVFFQPVENTCVFDYTLPYSACLCPAQCCELGGEKSPRLLVVLHLPMGGDIFTGLFFV